MRRRCKTTSVVTIAIIHCVQEIIDDHPEFYLDKIQATICIRLSIFLSITTIYRILKDRLGYTLQVCYDSAAQKNANEQAVYQTADQLVFVDETHKDKHGSRGMKAWGPRDSGRIALRRWF